MKRFSLGAGLAALLALTLENVAPSLAVERTSAVRGRGRRKLAVGSTRPSKGKGKAKSYDADGSYDEGDEDNLFDHNSRTQIESEEGFVAYCRSSLLSFGAASDGLISQLDVAEFIWDICEIFDHESIPYFRCPTPEFANLDIEIQMSFVWYICPNDDQVSTLTCLGNLGLQQAEFGYPITADDYQTGVDSILGFCCSLLPFLEQTGITPMSSSVCPTSLPVIDLSTPTPVAQQTTLPVPTSLLTPPPTGMPVTSPTMPSTPIPTPVQNNVSGLTPAPQVTGQPTTSTQGQPVIIARGSEGEQEIDTPNTLSVGGTVGIVLGSAAFVMAFALFARRRRNANNYS